MFRRKKGRSADVEPADVQSDDVQSADVQSADVQCDDSASDDAESDFFPEDRTAEESAPRRRSRRTARARRRDREDAAAAAREAAALPTATEGPWDADDAPDDDLNRVDLGPLQVATLAGTELRLEAAPTGEVVAVVITDGTSGVQLGVFAAPKTEGIWTEVRREIVEQLAVEGGSGTVRDGSFGPEVLATVIGPEGESQVRFAGIDGPRWFVRALFTGPAATDAASAALLEESVRAMVVARGGEAMPVRDPLPLHLPEEAMRAAEDEVAAEQGVTESDPDGGEQASLTAPAMPRRGPEITETR